MTSLLAQQRLLCSDQMDFLLNLQNWTLYRAFRRVDTLYLFELRSKNYLFIFHFRKFPLVYLLNPLRRSSLLGLAEL